MDIEIELCSSSLSTPENCMKQKTVSGCIDILIK